MFKVILAQLVKAILEYKWHVVIFAAAAVLFCGAIYLATRDFKWSYGKIRAFAVFYNLNGNGRTALALMFSRLVFVLCMMVFGGSTGFWDLLVLVLFTLAITVSSRMPKELLQIFSYAAIFAIALLENLFLNFYREIQENAIIVAVAVFFGLFGFLYAVYQTLSSYNNLLARTADTDKKQFDKAFYEKEQQPDTL